MPDTSYEIRRCESCGLRYPLVQEHPFGTRCPACLGSTRLILHRQIRPEPGSHPAFPPPAERSRRLAVLLDNIRSAWNVGSILRSADGFGFSHAYLCGITPSADKEAVRKTALGAQDSVPWSSHPDAVRLVRGLKGQGWTVLALEDDPRALPISPSRPPSLPPDSVLILGNEVTGVDPGLLELCDQILYIPMLGEKKSFNVAIAFSIAAYGLQAGEPEP